jgi:hypothetical protein
MKIPALFFAALMATAAPLFAQTQTPWSVPQWTPSRDPLPTWSVPQLPSIGLPLPPIGPPPARPRGNDHHPRRQWNDRTPAYAGWPLMLYMAWPPPMPAAPRGAEPAPPVEAPAKGSLVLRVQPGTAQVWVDGYYAGSADDFNGSPRTLALEAGPHTIELDEPAHETVRFDVRTVSNEPIVYRRELTRVSVAPPAPIPSTSTPVYLIPGCYLGNVPPKDAELPATCDPSRAVRLR